MSHRQDSNSKDFKYIKNFHIKSSLQVDTIKARDLIKSKTLPKFDIISQDLNLFTVALAHYEKNGLEEIFNAVENKQLFQKHIVAVFHAFLLIQNLFGKFFLTDDKIRADRDGNVVLWFNKNYQLSIPFLSRKTPIERGQYKKKFHEYLNKIKWILKRKISSESLKVKFLDFDQKLDYIKKSFQFQGLDKMRIQLNLQIQKYQSEFNKIRYQNSKNQSISSISYLVLNQNESTNINPFKKSENSTFVLNAEKLPQMTAQMTSLEHVKSQSISFQNVVKRQNSIHTIENNLLLKEQTRIPKFIKQKRLNKSAQVACQPCQKNSIPQTNASSQQIQKKGEIKNKKNKRSFCSSTFSSLKLHESVFISDGNKEIFSKLNKSYSKAPISNRHRVRRQQNRYFKSTLSNLKSISQKLFDFSAFVPKLTLAQEQQISDDLFQLFSSRSKTKRSTDQTKRQYNTKELFNQLLCILE